MDTDVLIAVQRGSEISNMILEIEKAWSINDRTYDEFQSLSFQYHKLADDIYEYADIFSKDDEQEKRVKMVD